MVDSLGHNAYYWAILFADITICRLLSEKGPFQASASDVYMLSMVSKDFVDELLDIDPTLAFIKDDEDSLLHTLVRNNDLQLLKMIQKKLLKLFRIAFILLFKMKPFFIYP